MMKVMIVKEVIKGDVLPVAMFSVLCAYVVFDLRKKRTMLPKLGGC